MYQAEISPLAQLILQGIVNEVPKALHALHGTLH